MVIKAEFLGREALRQKLNKLAPNVEKYTEAAKYEIMQEAAERIRQAAPRGATQVYAETIDGDFLRNRTGAHVLPGTNPTKDSSAAGLFAMFIWRFLEFGTAPHNVEKGGGTALGKAKLKGGEGRLHPGTRAMPHIFPVWRAYRQEARRKLLTAINRGVREAMKK
ncbi:HK97 gp10 family phage protein [Rhizobium sp. BK491]|uniref:HK97 gp10 family phage protein n=1 Tax=Rhizobium sp. BK491 TaxID=2587009 RepID=UPI00160A92E8|nr:HK97 gp10 family phage protein [Rhizobium sp. BK491]MBB3567225.1 hypothetical protein [Rhizobium sp. BK491]